MNTYREKLIEVDLPLDVINREAARDASITHGHPSTLHRYWARRPLAACRAVIFASLVDDPSSYDEELTEAEIITERARLHELIERLVVWKNCNDEKLLEEARYEIARSVARSRGETAPTDPEAVLRYLGENALPIYDPFCGGGSIPLEAQRLGLRARGSDLNPLPVLITKALVELPIPFHNQHPINPEADPLGTFIGKGKKQKRVPWRGASGLANDIRYYGAWMREEAFKRIGNLYPKVKLTDNTEATVIAWLWAHTVPCPNPACGIHMPLTKTFQISKKERRPYWARPVVDKASNTISFVVQNHNEGVPEEGTVTQTSASCVVCKDSVKLEYVRQQAKAGNMREVMTAIVAEGNRQKLFISPANAQIQTALAAKPKWQPTQEITENPKVSGVAYGMTHWHQLFTQRQLDVLSTFGDLLGEVRSLIRDAGASDQYTDTLCTYLAFAIGRTAESDSRASFWNNTNTSIAPTFTRQAIQMTWVFAESNPFSTSTQNWLSQVDWIAKVVERLPASANEGKVYQADAATTAHADDSPVIVTDPPYYNNILYADLSDFFYVWIRPLLRDIYPGLFASILTPKTDEIVAAPRFENPNQHFETVMAQTLKRIRERCTDDFPTSIFYAYKQQDNQSGTSTGWETMLGALISAGFQIVGTWPMRTERVTGVKTKVNALASSVVLVCRPRPADAGTGTRRQFLDGLAREMPSVLDRLTRGDHIAPVDLAQAAIGPGMKIYSRYQRVERINGEPVTVREALAAINKTIDDYDEQQEGDLDPPSRFCLRWLKQNEYLEGAYGDADGLARAQDVVISSMNSRVLSAEKGSLRLFTLEEYSETASLRKRPAETAWEGCFRMVWHMDPFREDALGVEGAAVIARDMRDNGQDLEAVERLARILYNHYDRKSDSENAVRFNYLVTEWQNITVKMASDEQLTFHERR